MNREFDKHLTESIRPSSSGDDNSSKTGAKRKRIPGTPGRRQQRHEEIPWTAARCNRLLRTIASRIHILRRLSENNFADKAAARKSPARRKIVFNPVSDDGGRASPEGVENVRSKLASLPASESPTKGGDDPDWFPEDGRKVAQRTYAGKGSKARKNKIEEPLEPVRSSDHVDFRSPFIKRILRIDAANSPTNPITDTPRRITSQRGIVLDPKTHSERALRTLLDSFDKVLSTTTHANTGHRLGASKIRDMCLRKVPDYIDFEQKYAYDEEEYDFDATETIYVDLEKLGNGGWHGLREVVRAHAVKMIADAMDERSWPVESLDRLLDVCERNQAVAEGQQILRSWFTKSDGRALNRMTKMLAWSKILDCTGFFFRTLRESLEQGRLRVHEFAECPGVWQDLLKALARKSTRIEAAQFLEVYALACMQTDDDISKGIEDVRLHDRLKRDEILQNVMVLVTAVCWTSDDTATPLTDQSHCLSLHIHRIAIAAYRLSSQQVFVPPRKMLRSVGLFLTSSLLLNAVNLDGAGWQEELLSIDTVAHHLAMQAEQASQQSHGQNHILAGAEFVCSTAKCIAHISQTTANGFIKDVATSIVLLSKRTSAQAKAVLKQFAIDIASAWADYREDNDSYAFAEDLEKAAFHISPTKEIEHTPGSAQKPKKFRWEEAIGEWIASTPLASATKATPLKQEALLDEKVGDHIMEEENEPLNMPVGELSQADVEQSNASMRREAEAIRSTNPYSTSPSSASSRAPSLSPTRDDARPDPEHDSSNIVVAQSSMSTAHALKLEPPTCPAQFADSPMQAKALRLAVEQPLHQGDERDELAATPYKIPNSGLSSTADSINDELAPETPACPAQSNERQMNLTLRSKPLPKAGFNQTHDRVERDELAMTPAHQLSHPPIEPSSLEYNTEPPAVQHTAEEKDELSATPARRTIPSTRVLRSAKQKSAPPVQEVEIWLDPRDELAMTPAQRVVATPRRTKLLKQNAAVAATMSEPPERDELGGTPQVLRTLRSRPKQAARTKSRGKVQKAHTNIEMGQGISHPLKKQAVMPLGARSANAGTAVKKQKGGGSGDELGL